MCIFLALRGKRDATAAQCETGREIASGGKRRRENFVPFFFHLFLWPLEEESFPLPYFPSHFPPCQRGEVNLVRRRDFDFPSPSPPEREGGREREKGQTDRRGRRRGREIRGTSAVFGEKAGGWIRQKELWVLGPWHVCKNREGGIDGSKKKLNKNYFLLTFCKSSSWTFCTRPAPSALRRRTPAGCCRGVPSLERENLR